MLAGLFDHTDRETHGYQMIELEQTDAELWKARREYPSGTDTNKD